MSDDKLNRRDFVKSAVGAGAVIGALGKAPAIGKSILGSNDRTNVALIGCGGRGRYLLKWVMDTGLRPNTPAQVVAACDVYNKRKRLAQETAKCDGFTD
jgi:hypothetical protein